jgi:hypothetical protein
VSDYELSDIIEAGEISRRGANDAAFLFRQSARGERGAFACADVGKNYIKNREVNL